jgi:hypothetical protein
MAIGEFPDLIVSEKARRNLLTMGASLKFHRKPRNHSTPNTIRCQINPFLLSRSSLVANLKFIKNGVPP